jgi:hypothetical protein
MLALIAKYACLGERAEAVILDARDPALGDALACAKRWTNWTRHSRVQARRG